MSKAERKITKADIMPMDEFGLVRKQKRAALLPHKKLRRIDVGPYCTFYFESYDTMWFQVEEMLYIEKGGEAQIDDELSAYNPLIPNGNDLVATMMFEIEDPVRRLNMLLRLGGIENHVFLQIGDDKVYVVPEDDTERTTEDGKTSSVHFFHFPLTPAQKTAFQNPQINVMLGTDHPNYGHLSLLTPTTRAELALDFS